VEVTGLDLGRGLILVNLSPFDVISESTLNLYAHRRFMRFLLSFTALVFGHDLIQFVEIDLSRDMTSVGFTCFRDVGWISSAGLVCLHS
jgi:hypothetical protein